MLSKVIFLDRDGVINRDSPDYIKSWDEFEFLPGSLQAIRRLTENGCSLIVITNQSAVGRGLITVAALEAIHRRMTAAIREAGGRLTDIFYCPHTPEARCGCRKPLPGLIRRACRRYFVDLPQAVMVGDRPGDIACGRSAGCGRTILISQGAPHAMTGPTADRVAGSLLDCVEWILTGPVCLP